MKNALLPLPTQPAPGFENHPALLEYQRLHRAYEAAYSQWQEATRREFETGLDAWYEGRGADGWKEGRRRSQEALARLNQAHEECEAAFARWRKIKRELDRAEIRRALQFWKWGSN